MSFARRVVALAPIAAAFAGCGGTNPLPATPAAAGVTIASAHRVTAPGPHLRVPASPHSSTR